VNGVVVMAYGTPARREDIAAYYTDIRRGRPPTDEQLADLTRRYDAIAGDGGGHGLSPLAERTVRQRAAIAAELDARAPGRYVVEIGLRHAEPTIEQAIGALAERAVDRLIGVVLAPHYSSMSIAAYFQRASAASAERGVAFTGIESWATEPAYVDFLAADVRRQLAELPAATRVVFTAHSLPERILAAGDRYPGELRATATAVAAAAGLGADRWSVGWQSAGRTPEPWIGPDILTVIDDLAAAPDVDGVLVCPCGFVSDHLEVLYDLDIEARGRAGSNGLAFGRTTSVNDDAAVMAALARLVIAA
jgi:ferrochelatase